jgi:hypothetical protein
MANEQRGTAMDTKLFQKIEVLLSVGLLIAFFLPWAKVFFFTGSGYDLGVHMKGEAKLVWFIPAACIAVILLAFYEQSTRLASEIAGALPFIFLLGVAVELKLGEDAPKFFLEVLSVGAYLSLALGAALILFGFGLIKSPLAGVYASSLKEDDVPKRQGTADISAGIATSLPESKSELAPPIQLVPSTAVSEIPLEAPTEKKSIETSPQPTLTLKPDVVSVPKWALPLSGFIATAVVGFLEIYFYETRQEIEQMRAEKEAQARFTAQEQALAEKRTSAIAHK